jgi:hypothetical protein
VGRTAKRDEAEKVKEQPPILKYIKTQVRICDVDITGTQSVHIIETKCKI